MKLFSLESIKALLAALCFFITHSYAYEPASERLDKNMEKLMEKSVPWQKGTVHYFNIEGGFYGIVASNGDKLLAINLDKTLRQHGTIVKFQGQEITDMATIKQWGVPFRITAFKRLKKGSNASLQPDR